MNQKDAERTQKDLERCLGIIATNLIAKTENPYHVEGYEIEDNGTTRRKTLRLLQESGHIGWYPHDSRSGQASFNFREQFNNMAEGLAEEPIISAVPSEVKQALDNNKDYYQITSKHGDIDLVGYVNIQHLAPREKMYVWFHLNEYVVIKGEQDSEYTRRKNKKKYLVYPRKMLDQRKLHATRALFKKYASPLLMPWLANKFGLSLIGFDAHTEHQEPVVENTHYSDNSTTLKLRSAMRYPVALNEGCFDSPSKGYHTEYASRLEWLKAKTSTLSSLQSKVIDYGYEKLMTEFVEYAKEEVLTEAPILMAEGEEAGAGMMILDSIHLITYNNMFGDNSEQTRQSAAA